MSLPKNYRIVRAIAFVLKLVAWVVLAAGLLVAIVAAASGGGSGGAAQLGQILRSVGMLVGPLIGIVWFVQLYAFGSILTLLLDIEENTRALATQPSVSAASVDLA